ncbi:MAG: oligosaccharide flippase family protein [Ignavibacteriales bacterium]|nr:oligosaccharide flippase family protein [Ignavibacterium sp.]MCZ2268563.1 oligosaccharide flippase family protein [Ignavibacteriales bacterium]HMN17964.1 oligosaccharide flippase family protein [Ignavibacteriaceae bacterium]
MKILRLKYFFSDLFNFKNASRSEKAKKNIILLFIVQVFNFLSIMALVPVSIAYLGNEEYGIWLTLASILSWLINLDFGIGNGLRNKLAEALALNDLKLARIYVSTAYTVFFIGITFAFLIYLTVHGMLNWAAILKAPSDYVNLLNTLILWIIVLFLVQFLLKLLTSIINADQRPALNGVLSLSINALILLAVLFLSQITEKSFTSFAIVSSSVPVLVLFAASVFLFSGHYKNISPSIRFIDFKYSSNLVKLGMQFFIIQISGLIVFTTDNIIIAQLFGPGQVVTYNIAYKYFYMIPLVFNVVLAPFWSAFTEAYVKKEYSWIQNAIRKLLIIWIILSLIAVFMIIISNIVYSIWVGSEIQVPFILSIFTGIFVIIANWNNIFAYFINGVGKIRIALYYSIFTALINIPLSILLAKQFGLGISGVILATNICLIIASVWSPIQYYKIINNKASGIWNK